MPETTNLADLRNSIFSQPDPASSPLLDLLIGQEIAARQEAAVQPPMLSIGDSPRNTLASAPGLRCKVQIRTTHVPTAIVHVLLEEATPLITVTLQNQTENSVLTCRVRTWVEGYSATAVKTVPVRRAAGEISISLLPTFFPQAIRELHEITAATVHVAIDQIDGDELSESTGRVWLLPQTSVILEARDPATGKRTDYKRYLAAYVTPNDPPVLALLREAAALHPNRQLAGDIGAAPEQIQAEVDAIYRAVKNRNIAYVNSILVFLPDEGLSGQRVRLPRESLSSGSANCIDGVLLLASLLEAASLNPALVFLPGHAVVAWEKARDSGTWSYIESTLLGTADFDVAVKSGARLAAKFVAANLLEQYPLRALRKSGIFPLA
jgi:hypothetical protein